MHNFQQNSLDTVTNKPQDFGNILSRLSCILEIRQKQLSELDEKLQRVKPFPDNNLPEEKQEAPEQKVENFVSSIYSYLSLMDQQNRYMSHKLKHIEELL